MLDGNLTFGESFVHDLGSGRIRRSSRLFDIVKLTDHGGTLEVGVDQILVGSGNELAHIVVERFKGVAVVAGDVAFGNSGVIWASALCRNERLQETEEFLAGGHSADEMQDLNVLQVLVALKLSIMAFADVISVFSKVAPLSREEIARAASPA